MSGVDREALLEEILRVMAQASVGDLERRIEVPEQALQEAPDLGVIAHALNILLGDLAHLTAETEQARRQMAHSEKLSALGALTSGVAHELRTPLTYIANALALVERRATRLAQQAGDAEAEAEVRDMVGLAREGVERAQRLVEELRRYARTPADERRVVSLDEAVRGAVHVFRATHRGDVVVRAELRPTPPVHVDERRVQQVVLNLLQNGAEAMQGRGELHVATEATPEGGARLRVRDQGPGIPPDLVDRIFQPFYTTKETGTGLGLAITSRIVEEHDGRIAVRSEPGRGAEFVVELPPHQHAGERG
ncbi:MAG TPA: ATP-binding protein [Candidatus Thermoplasmatota archaeon]|nr:ATP-binding protein [Candidatus Thermoplasmatota archaeon]